jgi:hypothetical protein
VITESAVVLAQVVLHPTESTFPPPTGPMRLLPMVRALMLITCVLCGAAFAVALGRITWTRISKKGREAKTAEVLIGTAVCFLVSFAGYKFMGWIA